MLDIINDIQDPLLKKQKIGVAFGSHKRKADLKL